MESIDQPVIGHNSQVSNLLLVPGRNAVSPFNGLWFQCLHIEYLQWGLKNLSFNQLECGFKQLCNFPGFQHLGKATAALWHCHFDTDIFTG